VTPTLAGSRPGGLVASCWASMMTLGQMGYEKNVAAILAARREVLLLLLLLLLPVVLLCSCVVY
jgi:glutamate/tyrosine decarboxylase-like PLP-dependent enzyme